MNPKEFVNTIYLGDRFCKSILIDGYSEIVKIQVDMISRIRSSSGEWQYYNDENIENGFIVFTEVESITFEPKGIIPNDEIEFIDVKNVDGEDNKFIFKLVCASYNKKGMYDNGSITIVAEGIYLEDPTNLETKIID